MFQNNYGNWGGKKATSECTHIKVLVVYRVCVDTLYACVLLLSCFSFFFLSLLLLAFPLAEKAERRRAISIESVRAVAVQSLVRRSGPERDPSDRLSIFHSLFSRLLIWCFAFIFNLKISCRDDEQIISSVTRKAVIVPSKYPRDTVRLAGVRSRKKKNFFRIPVRSWISLSF